MNNKILARVVAAVMVVAMLGTVSFAAGTGSVDKGNNQVTTNSDVTAANTETVLAFANVGTTVPETIADANILAVFQADEDDSYIGSFTYDPSRIASGMDTIIVLFRGKDGATDQVNISIVDKKDNVIDKVEVYKTLTIDSTVYTNLVGATYTYENKDAEADTVTAYGIKMAPYASDATNVYEGTVADFPFLTGGNTVTVQGGGTLTFTAILLGVPNEKIDSVGARAYVDFQ